MATNSSIAIVNAAFHASQVALSVLSTKLIDFYDALCSFSGLNSPDAKEFNAYFRQTFLLMAGCTLPQAWIEAVRLPKSKESHLASARLETSIFLSRVFQQVTRRTAKTASAATAALNAAAPIMASKVAFPTPAPPKPVEAASTRVSILRACNTTTTTTTTTTVATPASYIGRISSTAAKTTKTSLTTLKNTTTKITVAPDVATPATPPDISVSRVTGHNYLILRISKALEKLLDGLPSNESTRNKMEEAIRGVIVADFDQGFALQSGRRDGADAPFLTPVYVSALGRALAGGSRRSILANSRHGLTEEDDKAEDNLSISPFGTTKVASDIIVAAKAAARKAFALSPTAALLTPITDPFSLALFGPTAINVGLCSEKQDISSGRGFDGSASLGQLHTLTGDTYFWGVALPTGVVINIKNFVVLQEGLEAVTGASARAIDRCLSLARPGIPNALFSFRGHCAGNFPLLSGASYAAEELGDPSNRNSLETMLALKEARDLLAAGASFDVVDQRARGDEGYAFSAQHVRGKNPIVEILSIYYDCIAMAFFAHVILYARAQDTHVGPSANPRALFKLSECGVIPMSSILSVVDVRVIDPQDAVMLKGYAGSVTKNLKADGKLVPLSLQAALDSPVPDAQLLWQTSGGGPESLFDYALGGAVFGVMHESLSDGSLLCGESRKLNSTADLSSDNDKPHPCVDVNVPHCDGAISIPDLRCSTCTHKQRKSSGELPQALGLCGSSTLNGIPTRLAAAVLYRDQVIAPGLGVYISRTPGIGHWRLPLNCTQGSRDSQAAANERLNFNSTSHPLFDSAAAKSSSDHALAHGNAHCYEVALVVAIHELPDSTILLEVAPLARATDVATRLVMEDATLQLLVPHDREILPIPVVDIKGVCGVLHRNTPANLGGTFADVFSTTTGFDCCSSETVLPRGRGTKQSKVQQLSQTNLNEGKQCSCLGPARFATTFSLDSAEGRAKCARSLLLLQHPRLNDLEYPRLPLAAVALLGTDVDPLNATLSPPQSDQLDSRLSNVVDFCAGAGGGIQGVFESGLGRIGTAIDIDGDAINSLTKLISVSASRVGYDGKKTAVIHANVNSILHQNDGRIGVAGSVDGAFTGTPCGGFSGLNRFPDTDNSIAVANVTQSVGSALLVNRPLVLGIENVVPSTMHVNMQAVRSAFLDDGFSVRTFVFSVAASGVPSRRNRWVLFASAPTRLLPGVPLPIHATAVGPRMATIPNFDSGTGIIINGLPHRFGGEAPLPPITISKVFAGMPSPLSQEGSATYSPLKDDRDALLLRGNATSLQSHVPFGVAELFKPFIEAVALHHGANLGTLPAALANTLPTALLRGGIKHVSRLSPFGLAPTIVANSSSFSGTVAPPLAINRRGPVTPAELGRIQTCDDETVPQGNPVKVAAQLGMMIPPAFSRHLCTSMARSRWFR
jgi:site-specific DNA-cytosine methylase